MTQRHTKSKEKKNRLINYNRKQHIFYNKNVPQPTP